jgi:uncharacterized membrane protein
MTSTSLIPANPPDACPGLVVATSAALLTLAPIAARQLGLIDHLPDPPQKIFASDKITGSSLAHPLGVPDSLLGIASYSASLTLALLARERPLARKLLAAKLVTDGAVAGINTARQIASFRKLCSWCAATLLCTAIMLVAGRKIIASELSTPAA